MMERLDLMPFAHLNIFKRYKLKIINKASDGRDLSKFYSHFSCPLIYVFWRRVSEIIVPSRQRNPLSDETNE